jgi:hypothetical protein
MNAIWRRLSAEPALATGAIVATVNVVAAFQAWTPTAAQLAAVNSALAAVFALLIRATVKPQHGTPVRRRRSRPRRKPAPVPQPGVSTGEPGSNEASSGQIVVAR